MSCCQWLAKDSISTNKTQRKAQLSTSEARIDNVIEIEGGYKLVFMRLRSTAMDSHQGTIKMDDRHVHGTWEIQISSKEDEINQRRHMDYSQESTIGLF